MAQTRAGGIMHNQIPGREVEAVILQAFRALCADYPAFMQDMATALTLERWKAGAMFGGYDFRVRIASENCGQP